MIYIIDAKETKYFSIKTKIRQVNSHKVMNPIKNSNKLIRNEIMIETL